MRSSLSSRRAIRVALLLLGAALVAGILWKAGWPKVAANLARVGWWFVAIVALNALSQLASLEGWRQVLTPPVPPSFLVRLAGPSLAGDAVNYVGAGVAGEPVRAVLIREHVGSAQSFASITLRKHAQLGAQVVFLVAGVAVALVVFPLPALLAAAAAIGALSVVAAFVLMTWALRRGSYSPIIRRLSAFRPLGALLARFENRAADVDAAVRAFYARHGARFAASAGWALLVWLGGLFETWVILRLLGCDTGWAGALAVETLSMALNTMLLFIPGRLGSAEAVRTAVFLALGLPAAAGAAYSLVRRGREIVWVVPGAIYLFQRHAGNWLRGDAAGIDAGIGAPIRGVEAR